MWQLKGLPQCACLVNCEESVVQSLSVPSGPCQLYITVCFYILFDVDFVICTQLIEKASISPSFSPKREMQCKTLVFWGKLTISWTELWFCRQSKSSNKASVGPSVHSWKLEFEQHNIMWRIGSNLFCSLCSENVCSQFVSFHVSLAVKNNNNKIWANTKKQNKASRVLWSGLCRIVLSRSSVWNHRGGELHFCVDMIVSVLKTDTGMF